MKRIILSFLQRWWLRYLIACLLAAVVDVAVQFVPELKQVWTPGLFAPWLGGFVITMDLITGTAALTVMLPVSTRRAGLAYWLLGVCAPMVLLLAVQFGAGLIGKAWGAGSLPGCLDLLRYALITFLLAGTSFFTSTLLPMNRREPDSFLEGFFFQMQTTGLVLLWMASMMSGFALPQVLAWLKGSVVGTWSLVLVGTLLTVIGLSRATGMILRRARIRLVNTTPKRKAMPLQLHGSFAQTGLLALFTDTFIVTIPMALFGLGLMLGFRFLRGNTMFVYFLCGFISLMAPMRYVLSMRALRALPISTTRFALLLCLLPVLNAVVFCGLVIGGAALMGSALFTSESAAQLGLVAGLACISSIVCVRFGPKAVAGLAFVGVWMVMIFAFLATTFHFPIVVFYGLGLGSVVLSFFLARRWVGNSGTYRSRADTVVLA